MKRRPATIALTTLAALAFLMAGAVAQDKFQKLTGTQIRAKLTGMKITDQVHWFDIYQPNGTIASIEMGNKHAGTWRVQNDLLCTDHGKDAESVCQEVWLSGAKVEMRRPGSTLPLLEGVLEKPSGHR
jgi:hypothetical protein